MSFFSKKLSKKTADIPAGIHPPEQGQPVMQLSVEHQIPTERPKNISDIEAIWKSIPYWAENYYVYNRFLCKYENVYVTENGVTFTDKRVFADTVIYEEHQEKYTLNVLKKDIEKKQEKKLPNGNYLAIYNYWSSNYFHWVIDNLIKLVALQDLCSHLNLVLLVPSTAPDFVHKTVCYFSFPIEYFESSQYIFCKNLYSVNNLSPSGLCHPLVKRLPSLFNAGVNKTFDKKMYVSRAMSQIRHIANEDILLPILQKHGFVTTHNELLSFEEQVALFSQARAIIAPHGAGLTNILFMQQGATVIELASENIRNQPTCYWNLANMMGLNYYYVPCPWDADKNGYMLTADTLRYIDDLLKKTGLLV